MSDVKLEDLHLEHAQEEAEDVEVPIHWRAIVAILVANLASYAQLLSIVGPGNMISYLVEDLGGADQVVWLIAAPTLCQAAAAPLVARLSDMYGRKWVAIIPQTIGIIGTTVCATAHDMNRLVTGTCIFSLSITIVGITSTIPSEVLPRRYRTIGQASVQLAASAGTLTAALVSGAFLQQDPIHGWRNFYYLLIALYSISTLGFIVAYNPPPLPSQHKRSVGQLLHDLDVVGIGLYAASFALILVGLNWGGGLYAWSSPHVIGVIVAGAVCLVVMILWEMFARTDGFLDHRLFRAGRNLWLACFGLFVDGWLYFAGFAAYYPQEIRALGWATTPMAIALRSFYFAVFVCSATPFLSYYVTKTQDVRGPLTIGYIMFTVAIGLFTIVGTGSSGFSIGISALAGVGFCAPLVLLVMVAQLGAPVDLIATVTAIVASVRGLGGSIGSVVMGVAYNNRFDSCVAAATRTTLECQVVGYKWAWISLLPPAILAVIAGATLSSVKKTMTWAVDNPIEPPQSRPVTAS